MFRIGMGSAPEIDELRELLGETLPGKSVRVDLVTARPSAPMRTAHMCCDVRGSLQRFGEFV
jgi:hypothetical protein